MFVYFCEKNCHKKLFSQKSSKTENYRSKYRLKSVKKLLIRTSVKISVNFVYFRLNIGYTTCQGLTSDSFGLRISFGFIWIGSLRLSRFESD